MSSSPSPTRDTLTPAEGAEYSSPFFAELAVTYGEAPEGKPCALVDSGGRLEIAVRGGSAATILGLEGGDAVEIRIGEAG